MKKKLLLSGASLCFVIIVICTLFIFGSVSKNKDKNKETVISDISEAYAGDAIKAMTANGVMPLYKSGETYMFFPDMPVTKEYFSFVIVKFLGIDISEYDSIPINARDTSSVSENCLGYIKAAVDNSIISLENDGSGNYIRPSKAVLREECASVVSRMTSTYISSSKADAFPDFEETSPQYVSAVSVLVGYDIMIGYPDGTLRPTSVLTRQELALILYRVLNNDEFNS